MSIKLREVKGRCSHASQCLPKSDIPSFAPLMRAFGSQVDKTRYQVTQTHAIPSERSMWRHERDWNGVKKPAWEKTRHQEGPGPVQPFASPGHRLLQISRALQELGSTQENSQRNRSAGKSAWCNVHFIQPSVPKESRLPTRPVGLASRDGLTHPVSMCSMKYLRDGWMGFGKRALAPRPGTAASRWHSYAVVCIGMLSYAIRLKLPWKTQEEHFSYKNEGKRQIFILTRDDPVDFAN